MIADVGDRVDPAAPTRTPGSPLEADDPGPVLGVPSAMPCGVSLGDPLVALPVEGRCQQLARDLGALRLPGVIAVEGVDGSAKTTFAGQLAGTI